MGCSALTHPGDAAAVQVLRQYPRSEPCSFWLATAPAPGRLPSPAGLSFPAEWVTGSAVGLEDPLTYCFPFGREGGRLFLPAHRGPLRPQSSGSPRREGPVVTT